MFLEEFCVFRAIMSQLSQRDTEQQKNETNIVCLFFSA